MGDVMSIKWVDTWNVLEQGALPHEKTTDRMVKNDCKWITNVDSYPELIRNSKLELGIPYGPKGVKSSYQRASCTPMLTTALSARAKIWNQHRWISTENWINKMRRTHHGIVFGYKRMKSYYFWKMDRTREHLWNEIRKANAACT